MENVKLSNIPIFLEASDKKTLIGLMWANNAINGRGYNYMPPLKEGKQWVVWFYADITNYIKPGLKDIIENVEIR